uniref:Uncharacterized protein n=1 Tax=Schistocephalus solidus TaxID=70667 RepID=A0A0V0J6A3_SCHSO
MHINVHLLTTTVLEATVLLRKTTQSGSRDRIVCWLKDYFSLCPPCVQLGKWKSPLLPNKFEVLNDSVFLPHLHLLYSKYPLFAKFPDYIAVGHPIKKENSPKFLKENGLLLKNQNLFQTATLTYS